MSNFYEFFYGWFADFSVSMPTIPANQALRDFHGEPYLRTFGGPNFKQCANLLREVPLEFHGRFLVCLFIIVASDQNIHAHFREAYDGWRRLTEIPKFGWSGFGLHNEDPMKIIDVPMVGRLVPDKQLQDAITEGMTFFVEMIEQKLSQFTPTISRNAFFEHFLADPALSCLPDHPIVSALQHALREV